MDNLCCHGYASAQWSAYSSILKATARVGVVAKMRHNHVNKGNSGDQGLSLT